MGLHNAEYSLHGGLGRRIHNLLRVRKGRGRTQPGGFHLVSWLQKWGQGNMYDITDLDLVAMLCGPLVHFIPPFNTSSQSLHDLSHILVLAQSTILVVDSGP